jgi:TonB family protein
MKNFFIAIVVASVAFVFFSCKEEKRVTLSSHLTETKELATSQKNEKPICCFKDDYNVVESNDNVAHQRTLKNDSSSAGLDSSWYRRGKPIPGLCISVGETCFQSPDDPHTRIKYKGTIKLPSISDIDFKYEKKASRSASDIVKIIRQRTPGLHFTYYKHLRKNPGIKGKITLKFTIAPKGEISDISIVSSTTQNREFDTEIQRYVSRWMFHKIKSGKTTVTIPLTFTE